MLEQQLRIKNREDDEKGRDERKSMREVMKESAIQTEKPRK